MEAFIFIVCIVGITAVYAIKILQILEKKQLRKDIKKEDEENHSLYRKNNRLEKEKENLLVALDTQEYEIVVLEEDLKRQEKETARWNLNYQSMKRKKMNFQNFLINFKEGDEEKLDKLLKRMLSENKYLKAKQIMNDNNKQG